MAHTISIQNLGVIKEIKNFELKKINSVIGESASGKSLLAKAIFFFNEEDFVSSLVFGKRDNIIDESIKNFFSPYQNFTIQYNYTKELFIKFQFGKKIIYSPELKNKIKKAQLQLKKVEIAEVTEVTEIINKLKKNKIKNPKIIKQELQNMLDDFPKKNMDSDNIKKQFFLDLGVLPAIFIPATRSFVSDFDQLRLNYMHNRRLGRSFADKINNDITLSFFSQSYRIYLRKFEKLQKDYQPIMRGEVQKASPSEKLIFFTNQQKLDISEVSSGQKELFPILMLLQSILKRKEKKLIIIEEPEAHLFPKDQKAILDIIVKFTNASESKIFITTHSPYILMSMNNLLEAKTKNFEKLKEKFIDFKEINVQKLEKGKHANLLDEEDQLIDIEYITEISETIAEEFDEILYSKE